MIKTLLSFIFRKTVPKFFLFSALFYLVLEFTPVLINWVSGSDMILSISNSLGSIPNDVGYFLQPFRIDLGLKVVGSAYITRFIIRRVPLMG
ncbi:DUF2523 family protein [Ursidibacter sp. B-7004-1]